MPVTSTDKIHVTLNRSRLAVKQYSLWSYLKTLHNESKADWYARLLTTEYIARRDQAAFGNLGTAEKIKASARKLMATLVSDHATELADVAGSVPGALVAGPAFPAVNFNAPLGKAKKESVLDAVELWGNAVQKTLWNALVTHKAGGREGVAPAQHRTAAWKHGGVHCAVYLKEGDDWGQIGDDYLAQERARENQHAEMQWKDAHAAAFVQALAGATSAEFHITKVPCESYCSERMIGWWGTLQPPEDFVAYIYTYQDEQGGHHVYELHGDSILNIGTWVMA